MSAIRALHQCRVAARRVLRNAGTLLVAQHVSRAFSATSSRFSAGASDVPLSQKLAKELKFEKESAQRGEPDFLRSFKAEGVWTIDDVEDYHTILLTRTFGNEDICLIFTILDIEGLRVLAKLEGTAVEDQEDAHSHLIRMMITVTKDDAKGSFNVYAACQHGVFAVLNVPYYLDRTELTRDEDWKHRQFNKLDVSVQEGIEKWLDERGLNESMAAFVPEYVIYKEHKEYVKWLENVKNFVEA